MIANHRKPTTVLECMTRVICILSLAAACLIGCGKNPRSEQAKNATATGQTKQPVPSDKGIRRVIAQHVKLGDRFVKTEDYDLAAAEYQSVIRWLSEAQTQSQQRQARSDSPKVAASKPLDKALAIHRGLALKLERSKDYLLAIAEYEFVTDLLTRKESREQQNTGIQFTALNKEEERSQKKQEQAREDLQKWLDNQLKRKNLPATEQQKIQQEFTEKSRQLDAKFQPSIRELQEKRKNLQDELEGKVISLREERIKVMEGIADLYAVTGDKSQSQNRMAAVHMERASLYQQQKDTSKAEAEFRKWIKMKPDDFSAHSGLVQLYINTQKWSDAEKELRAQMQKAPDNIEYRSQLAAVLAYQKKWDAAVQQHREIIRLTGLQTPLISPNDPHAGEIKKQVQLRLAYRYMDLGRLLMDAKRSTEAKQVFEKAKAVSPDVAPQIPKLP